MSWVYEIGVKQPISAEGRTNNADLFYDYFKEQCSIAAIAGMLGNIQQESGINPGNMQTGSTSAGFGMIQWTPGTVLTDWATANGYNWYDGAAQCIRIDIECNDGTQYFYPSVKQDESVYDTSYKYTWSEYCALTDPKEAAASFYYQRERPNIEDTSLDERQDYAKDWYDHFTGETTVSVTQNLTNCTSTYTSTTATVGETINFKFTPSTGYIFSTAPTVTNGVTTSNCTINSDGTASISITVTGVVVVNAKATTSAGYDYTITYSLTNCTSNISQTGANYGDVLNFALTPAEGYKFTPTSVYVIISGTRHNLTVNTDGTASGSVTITGTTYVYGRATSTTPTPTPTARRHMPIYMMLKKLFRR